ncbi:MAG: peptidylprolyl isomerase, partial [Ignavibacteria bacterium]|nr:peptidylprolyl isomerase [Ignavibacteria bacterium]
TEITYQEFERIVQQQADQMRQQSGKDVDDATLSSIRDQVWNSLVSQAITKQAIDKYGITVSDKEILDWIYNRPETLPDPIKRNFVDSTGVFNAAFYQQALGMKNKEATQFWSQVENYLRETLMSEKLQMILGQGVVVSEEDVLQKYKDDNLMANMAYAFLDLNTVTDSSQFAVTDAEMKEYYDKNKDDFKQEEAVKLKYVQFIDQPSAEDSAALLKTMERFRKDLQTANVEDSSLIKLVMENSSVSWNPDFQKSNNFEAPVSKFLFRASPGEISEVIKGEDGYQVIKLLDVKQTEDPYVNASHILIDVQNSDTAGAKAKAQSLYERVKNGENINDLAVEFSTDPTAKQNRGDLGWFMKGAMVKEFEDAVFNANVGDLVGPVQTKYGFHIVKVTGKEAKEFKVAQLSKFVTPSARSKQLTKKKAEDFYDMVSKGENFDSTAKKLNLQVVPTQDVTRNMQIPMMNKKNSTLTNFLFESKVNAVTEPTKTNAGVYIYQVVEKKAEGFQNFDSIKVSLIKPKLINEKKFAVLTNIANDLETKIQNGDIMSLKTVAPQYVYEQVDSFTVSKPDPKIGQDFSVTTALFKMKDGEISKPVKGLRGVYILKLNSVTPFNEQDYIAKAAEIRKELLSTKRQQIVSEWLQKMQDEADIVDNRDKYL